MKRESAMRKSYWVKHRTATFEGKSLTLPTYWPSREDTPQKKWADYLQAMETLTGWKIADMSPEDDEGNFKIVLENAKGQKIPGTGWFSCSGFSDVHWEEPSQSEGRAPC
jgi:hypothetical protein